MITRTSKPSALSWATLACLVVACGYRPARFHDRPAVTRAGDDRPIPVPRRNAFVEAFYLSDVFLRRPVVDALDAERFPYAKDVNSLDQVPPSSWFSPIALQPEAFAREYSVEGPPRAPVRIEARGRALVLTDSRGKDYRLIRDHRDRPEVATAASLIASRLVRAVGYLTPESWRVDPVVVGLPQGPGPGGERWVALRWPLGIELGPTDMTYPRDDDPNDRASHRDRRTLRALGVLAAWLDLRDLGPSRLVDAYVGRPGRGHVRHFVVGLEDALGAAALSPRSERRSAVGPVEGDAFANLATLGLARPRQRDTSPEGSLRAFRAEIGGRYQLGHPYEPVDRLLPSDGYWIAKRLTRIPSSLIESSVRAAGFSDPALELHVIRSLEARRRTLSADWFARVTPCEVEAISGRTLLLSDEALLARFAASSESRYDVRFLGDDGKDLTPARSVIARAGQIEIRVPELDRNVIVVHVTAVRGGAPAPRAMEAHLRFDGSSLRLVGIRH